MAINASFIARPLLCSAATSQHQELPLDFFFCLGHAARLARLLLRNQSFSSIKRQKKGKRCLWDEAVIKHSWSLEFWRTGISLCGVQLKPFHKLALHVLWTLIFFSARFHYLLRQARFAPLKIHTHKHARAHTHNPLYLSLQPLAPWCIPPSPLPLVAGGGRGENDRPWEMTAVLFVIQLQQEAGGFNCIGESSLRRARGGGVGEEARTGWRWGGTLSVVIRRRH